MHQMANDTSEVEDLAGVVSADNHALREQKRRLRLHSCETDITMDEVETWTIANHHRAVVHLLCCLAGVEVWLTAKTSTFHLEQRLMEAYTR